MLSFLKSSDSDSMGNVSRKYILDRIPNVPDPSPGSRRKVCPEISPESIALHCMPIGINGLGRRRIIRIVLHSLWGRPNIELIQINDADVEARVAAF